MSSAAIGQFRGGRGGWRGSSRPAGGGGGGSGAGARHPEHPPSANLFINYVPPNVDEAQLTEVLTQYSGGIPPLSVFVMRHLDTRQSKGYAFALFPSVNVAAFAKQALDGFQWGSKRLQVRFADPPCSAGGGNRGTGVQDKNSSAAVVVSGADAPSTVVPAGPQSELISTFVPGPNGQMLYMFSSSSPAAGGALQQQQQQDNSAFLTSTNETNLYIKGLPPHWTRDELHKYFSQYGPIVDCALMLDQGRTTGMGFVDFEDSVTANRVVMECNGRIVEPMIYSVPLHIRFARNKKKRQHRADGGTAGPGGGGGGGGENGGDVDGQQRESAAPLPLPRSLPSSGSPAGLSPVTTSHTAASSSSSNSDAVPQPLKEKAFGPLLVHDPYALAHYRTVAPASASAPSRESQQQQQQHAPFGGPAERMYNGGYVAYQHQPPPYEAPIPRVALTAPLTPQPAHSCQYCRHGTSVILANMPYDATQCDIAVRKLLAPQGSVIYTECLGNGQAIATFSEHVEAVQAVQLLSSTAHGVALLDCTQLEPTPILGDFI